MRRFPGNDSAAKLWHFNEHGQCMIECRYLCVSDLTFKESFHLMIFLLVLMGFWLKGSVSDYGFLNPNYKTTHLSVPPVMRFHTHKHLTCLDTMKAFHTFGIVENVFYAIFCRG